MTTYSTRQVLALLDHRLTYRQLDYWIRRGIVVIECDAKGSGSQRRFNDAEVRALCDALDARDAAAATLAAFQAGELYRARLALHDALEPEMVA